MSRSTAPSVDANRRRPRWLLGSAALLIVLATGAAVAQPKKGTPMKTLDLWTAVHQLPTTLPFSAEKIAAALQTTLAQDSENEYFRFFKGGPVSLSEGVVIEAIDLRIKKEQPHPGFLVLTLAGTCVPTTAVFGRYPQLQMTGHPRGRSLDEEASYSRAEPWGKISFGFAERARDCLRSIVFAPN